MLEAEFLSEDDEMKMVVEYIDKLQLLMMNILARYATIDNMVHRFDRLLLMKIEVIKMCYLCLACTRLLSLEI